MHPFILIWIIILVPCSIPLVSCNHSDKTAVITIRDTGNNTLQCCAYGKCYCSNLSLALEHIQNNTEIRIMSSISLHGVPQFECTNDAKVAIIGYNNPVVKCNHQGGLVGRNVGHIVIHGITWDDCDQGIEIDGYVNVYITGCSFQHTLSVHYTLALRGDGLICINNSVFNNIGNRGVYLNIDNIDRNDTRSVPSLAIYNSAFNKSTLVIAIDDNITKFYSSILDVTIMHCSFTNNDFYSIHCMGTDHLLPKVTIISSDFVNNKCSIKAKNCTIALRSNSSFSENYNSAIDASHCTISMTGPILFYNNSNNLHLQKQFGYRGYVYGGALHLFHSNMSVNKGPIKFHNNVGDSGGAIYICKNSSISANTTDLEFYNNSATEYGGALYIESSLCEHGARSILYYYNLFANVHNASSNSAWSSGNFVYFFVYDALHCVAPNLPHKINNLFASQAYSVLSTHEAEVHGNFSDWYGTREFQFWMHDLHLNLIVTDCFNNLYGPVIVSICCKTPNFNGYRYNVDSAHNNITLMDNDFSLTCFTNEPHTLQLIATVSDYNTERSPSTHIYVKILSSSGHEETCGNDIAHFLIYNFHVNKEECVLLSCYLNFGPLSLTGSLPRGIGCYTDSKTFYVTPGHWFSNGFNKVVDNCPQGHCNSTFVLYDSIYKAELSGNVQYPVSNDQCASHWTGLACGECDEDNFIIHDSTSCVASSDCYLQKPYSLIVFFIISLFYWIIVISLLFVLLHFKLDVTAGYAYGIIFYYSVLEQTVNASYTGTHNDLNKPYMTTCLSILSSIGNMKPPFQFLNMCFGKFTMIDHTFVTFFHPVIVTCLIVAIFISARNSVTVARAIGRYVNSKSICILLILSYSSVSYTSLQLFRPLAVYNNQYSSWYTVEWHSYLSPAVIYFHGHHMIYCIIAVLCELIIGIGFPFILLFQRYLTRYCNINFISIIPIMDQLKGCYKEEYRWFASYYLMCRQLIYAGDIGTDFVPFMKFPIMLSVYILILMIHVWLQPYRQRKLNVLDSFILMTLLLVFIGEHTSYSSTIVLWILPLILFINCITFSSWLKYLLIPISCFGLMILSGLALTPPFLDWTGYTFFYINWVLEFISFIALLVYFIYALKFCVILIKRRYRPVYRLINVQSEDSNEDSNEES